MMVYVFINVEEWKRVKCISVQQRRIDRLVTMHRHEMSCPQHTVKVDDRYIRGAIGKLVWLHHPHSRSPVMGIADARVPVDERTWIFDPIGSE